MLLLENFFFFFFQMEMLRKLLVGGASKARADGEILMASLGWWVPIRKQGRGVELCRGNQR